ncbi:MAG: hypothetical protein AAF492_15595, partial [Verrucomicrobiota bacterium]
VERGAPIGTMGNTPSSIIPVVRSHLHFELGMIRNNRFDNWIASQKITNLHGRHHGWNLTGISPLDILAETAPARTFSMLDYLQRLPPAFELLIDVSRPLDYFSRYPDLWLGTRPASGAMVLSVSEGGVVSGGRPAHAAESERLQASSGPVVLSADSDVLGRNGLRLVIQSKGTWKIGRNGTKWLNILTH